MHADIAHPINSTCRERIQKAVEKAYLEEVERSKLPGYRPVDLDEPDDMDYHADSGRPSSIASDSGSNDVAPPEESKDNKPKSSFGDGIV